MSIHGFFTTLTAIIRAARLEKVKRLFTAPNTTNCFKYISFILIGWVGVMGFLDAVCGVNFDLTRKGGYGLVDVFAGVRGSFTIMTSQKKSWHQYAKRAAVPDRTGPDGFVYDSKTEMRRALDLQLLQRAGEISGLERQVRFPLVYDCTAQGGDKIEVMAGNRVAVYTADFVYFENGQRVIEDCKGYADETSKLRIRVFEALYRTKVNIIKYVPRGGGWVTT